MRKFLDNFKIHNVEENKPIECVGFDSSNKKGVTRTYLDLEKEQICYEINKDEIYVTEHFKEKAKKSLYNRTNQKILNLIKNEGKNLNIKRKFKGFKKFIYNLFNYKPNLFYQNIDFNDLLFNISIRTQTSKFYLIIPPHLEPYIKDSIYFSRANEFDDSLNIKRFGTYNDIPIYIDYTLNKYIFVGPGPTNTNDVINIFESPFKYETIDDKKGRVKYFKGEKSELLYCIYPIKNIYSKIKIDYEKPCLLKFINEEINKFINKYLVYRR